MLCSFLERYEIKFLLLGQEQVNRRLLLGSQEKKGINSYYGVRKSPILTTMEYAKSLKYE
tara:strand:- start:676817 stop:676996 length:180 start_codon:yes stop_codon:yes gene_type:complete